MLYALLCYNSEDVVAGWTKEEDDAVMGKLAVVHQKLAKKGQFGPTARLMPTTAATTLRKSVSGKRLEPAQEPPLVVDGPYAETKEQLLGFYVLDCENLEAALEAARELAVANPGGAYEVRPIALFLPGSLAP